MLSRTRFRFRVLVWAPPNNEGDAFVHPGMVKSRDKTVHSRGDVAVHDAMVEAAVTCAFGYKNTNKENNLLQPRGHFR